MEMIGRYQILRELGRGAGGVVYLAEDPKIGRKVAIKTIVAGAAGGDTLRKRLQREARSGGSLAHPNIVTVFEMDDSGAAIYIVMEFVEGKTLRSIMEAGGRLRSAEIIALLRQVAAGLDYAHARSVVHRDIKPANIMVTPDAGVKIADFGVAKMLDDATLGLTQAGMAVGTPHYMSPEQVLGKPVEGRSDQFSLAVIAYELLAGKRPFEGDSITSIMYQIVNEDPIREDTTGSIVGLPALPSLLRALAKDPAERYPTCTQFIDELETGLRLPRAAAQAKAEAPAVTVPVVEAATAPKPAEAPVVAPEPAPTAPAAEAPMETGPVFAAVAPGKRSSAGLWVTGVIAAAVLIGSGIYIFRNSTRKAASPEVPAQTAAPATAGETATPTARAAAGAPATPAASAAQKPGAQAGSAAAGKKTASSLTASAGEAKAAAPTAAAAAATPSEGAGTQPAEPRGPHGSFTWAGTLASGDSLEITGTDASFGAVTGKALPKRAPVVVVEVDPPDVHVSEAPSAGNGYKLILVNDGRDVSSITVSWRLARKGEAAE